MDANKLETKTLYSALRPPRVALFIDTTDKFWKKTILHILEILPSIWGGDGYIIIPSDGKNLHPYFREILRIYDPDFVLTYQRKGFDLKEDNSTRYKQVVDAYVKAFIKQNPAYKEADIRSDYEKQVLEGDLDRDFDLGDEIKKFVLKDLSVFHFRDDIREVTLDYSGLTPHLLPKLVDVICSSDRLKNLKIVNLRLDNFGIDYQLMGYGVAGKDDMLVKHLVERRQELEKLLPKIRKHAPDEVQQTEQMIQKLQWILLTQTERFKRSDASVMLKSFWNKKLDFEGLDFRQMWRALKKKDRKPSKTADYDFFTRVPFRISTLGLSYYMRRKDYLREEFDSPLVIVGDSVEDYCLYYSLIRLRYKVYWLPYKRLLTDSKKPNAGTYSFYLTNELRTEGHNSEDKNICWTSLSLKEKQKAKVPDLLEKSELVRSDQYGKLKDHLVFIENPKKLTSYVLRLYEKGNANNRSSYQFIDNKGVGFIDTPKPKTYEAKDPIKHKWISEVNIVDHTYPTADFLSNGIFSPEGVNTMHLGTTATRVSYTGVHYQCPAMGFITSADEVTDQLVKPKINLISANTIFDGYFKRKGLDIRPSDKGAYFLQVVNKLNGINQLSNLIKDKDAFALFNLFIDLSNRAGVFTKGAYLQSDKRRYVDFDSIQTLLKTSHSTDFKEKTILLLEKLLDIGLIERGYVFKCSNCKNCSWYNPKETDSGFICKRCGSANQIRTENLRVQAPELRYEPIVFYKLDELFYQFWFNNGWITALTLAKLKEKSESSLIYLPETEFRSNPNKEKADYEIDILAIVDGNLYFGEAKKDANSSDPNNKLKVEQVERLQGFDEFLPLKGLVFTSFSGNWPAEVEDKFDEIEKKSQFELIKFSSNEIF